jgi:RNA polymerase sigma-70 factor (ECF subfamily)
VARARHGEAAAFEALYSNHRDWVLHLAWRFTGNRDDALEVLQETFAELFEKLPGFRLTSSLRAYLYPVVKHRCLSLLRKRRPVIDIDTVREQGLEQALGLTWQPPATGELAPLLARLPAKQREVVLLRFALGMKLDEIADALKTRLGTVKSRRDRAETGL